MNIAQIRKFDVTNGPNIRTTLFVSGCTHNCEGCFNKEQQNFNYGVAWTKDQEDKFIEYTLNPRIKGVNILGGEPLEQTMDSDLSNLLRRIKEETGKPIWLWTGFIYEDIIKDDKKMEIVQYIDVLIDGKFEIDKRNLNLKYRGSENQRIIDFKESIKENRIIEIEI